MTKYLEVLLLGDSGVGKTRVLDHLLNKSIAQILPTEGVNRHILKVKLNQGLIKLRFWDPAGQYQGQDIDNYVALANCVIIVFDLSQWSGQQNIFKWVAKAELQRKPVIVVGNKTDQRVLTTSHITLPRSKGWPYWEISSVQKAELLFRTELVKTILTLASQPSLSYN